MSGQPTIDELVQRALADKTAEPALLEALLDKLVFTHASSDDASEFVEPVQIRCSGGLTVIPFFSDQAQAELAANAGVEVISVSGRVLFDATRGATMLLDPGGAAYTLYPEAISAALDGDNVALIQRVGPIDGTHPLAAPIDAAWLIAPRA